VTSPVPYVLSEPENLPAVGRKKFDAYFTPPALAHAAAGWLARDGFLVDGMRVLEPSAGKGAWVDAVRAHISPESMLAIDIDPDRCCELKARGIPALEGDFLAHDGASLAITSPWYPEVKSVDFDALVGNPPYTGAEAHVRRALALRSRFGMVAFLLRLSLLESKERIPFWKEHPASKVYVLSERPSFSGGTGTDNAAYAVICWAKWHRGPTELAVCSWKSPGFLSPVSTEIP